MVVTNVCCIVVGVPGEEVASPLASDETIPEPVPVWFVLLLT